MIEIKKFSEASSNDFCYILSDNNEDLISQSNKLLNNSYKNIIISEYDNIEDILRSLSFSNTQLISKKINFRSMDYMSIANIYENNWKYKIIKPSKKLNIIQFKEIDIVTLLRINNYKKTLKLLLINRNDNDLNSFEKAIFNLYATISISNKQFTNYEFDFNISNELFNNIKKDYSYKESNKYFKKDYVYYDKYELTDENVSKIIIGERYHKDYWFDYLNDIEIFVKKYIDRNSIICKNEYAVLEIVNENLYYYHYFMINSPNIVFIIDSINKFKLEKINIINKLSKLYPYKIFYLINDDFKIYKYVIYSNISLINSLTALSGALISKGKVLIYNTCPSIIRISSWINYETLSEFTVCCVGINNRFISHYINIGFTKIIFFNNSSYLKRFSNNSLRNYSEEFLEHNPSKESIDNYSKTKPSKNSLRNYSETSHSENSLKEFNDDHLKNIIEIPIDYEINNIEKFQLYNEAARYYCKENDKLLIIDDDEYLDIKSVNDIEVFDKNISFYWNIYGSGGQIYHNDDYSNYTYEYTSNEFKTMTIVNNNTIYNSNHNPDNYEKNMSIYKIKHYITESLEDYINKCKLRIKTLGKLRYEKHAYQIFIKANSMFTGLITKDDFNKLLISNDLKNDLKNIFKDKVSLN